MKNKTKWLSWGFFSLDYKAMEEYLEEMAEKGWMLEKVGNYLAKFKAIEPRKLKFYVDVFKEEGPLTPEKTEESEEYRNLCQESGWTFITSRNYLQFFYADRNSQPVPIQTDEAIEQKIVELTLLKNELGGILFFSIIAAWALLLNFPVKYTNLLSFTGITRTILFPVLCAFISIPAIYSIVWMLRARRNIKNALPIEKPTLKSARRRIMAFHVPVLIIASVYVLSFIGDAFFRPDTLLALIGPVVGITIGAGIRYLIKKKAANQEDVVLYVALAIIFTIIIIPIAFSFFSGSYIERHTVDTIADRYPVVTMEEILNDSALGIITDREFKAGMSPVVPMHYDYWESRDIGYITKYIDIKYYRAINPYFAEIIFNGITDSLEKGFKWQGMTFFEKTIITDDEMKSLWNADNLALTEERDEIIMRKGNIVLRLSGDMDFNDRHTRELIIKKIFTDSL